MQIDGTLAKWNDDRGFGFIAPTHGGQEIFVHISAFPRDGQRPRLGERLSFEIEIGSEGKKRAKAVSRPSTPRVTPNRSRPAVRPARTGTVLSRLVPVVLLGVLVAYGYGEYSRRTAARASGTMDATSSKSSPDLANPESRFRCDGRTHCSQMTSCAEATFFLKNCPGVEMDGDHDGIPCEQQWC